MPGGISVRILTGGDAPVLARLSEEIYSAGLGEVYTLSPGELAAAKESGDELVAMAFVRGQPAGFISLRRSKANRRLYELGMLSVLPRFRSGAAARELARFAREEFPLRADFDAVYMENVTSHRYSQRLSARAGAVDTAVLFSALPALAAPGKRLSFVLSCRERAGQPRMARVPRRYAEILPVFYQGLCPRVFVLAEERRPDGVSTIARYEYPTVGTAKVYVYGVGGDFAAGAAALSPYCRTAGMTVLVYLSLADAAVGYAAECLAGEGFFIGGVLPLCFGDDALIMQKPGAGAMESLCLYSEKSRELFALIKREGESVNFL